MQRGIRPNRLGMRSTWTTDGGIPIRCMVTSASMQDRQAALPWSRITEQRVTDRYEIMDRAYDAEAQRAEPRDGFQS